MEITQKLKLLLVNSGLTEEEASFYINALKKPSRTIYDIARRSKIQKDRAYKIYEHLIEKELIETSIEQRNKKIVARSLSRFIGKIQGEGRKLYKTADSLKSISNFLPLLQLPGEELTIETYKEEDFSEKFVDIAYMDCEKVLAYGTFEDFIENITISSDKQFVKIRLKRGHKCFPVLANPGPYTLEIAGNDKKEDRKTKLITTEKLRNTFVIILPESNRLSLWYKDNNGNMDGALITSKFLNKIHQNIYEYFYTIQKSNDQRLEAC